MDPAIHQWQAYPWMTGTPTDSALLLMNTKAPLEYTRYP